MALFNNVWCLAYFYGLLALYNQQTMNIFGTTSVVDIVASGTTSSLVTFSPLFEFVGGLVLAIIIISLLVSIITGRAVGGDDDFEI